MPCLLLPFDVQANGGSGGFPDGGRAVGVRGGSTGALLSAATRESGCFSKRMHILPEAVLRVAEGVMIQ